LKTKLSKELEKQDGEELLRLVKELARRFPVASMYLTMEFGLDSQPIIDKYKKQIYKEYFPTRGHGKARSSRVNKILKEFTQVAAFQEDVLDIRLYQVELAVEYYRSYVYDYEPFITNLFKNWSTLIGMLHKEGLVGDYNERVGRMFNDKFVRYFVGEQMQAMWEAGPEPEKETDSEED